MGGGTCGWVWHYGFQELCRIGVGAGIGEPAWIRWRSGRTTGSSVRCPTTQMPKGELESHSLESQIPPKAPSSSLRSAQSVSTPYVAAICRGHMPLLETAVPRCLIARLCEWAAKCICMFVFRVHSQRFVFSLSTQFNGRSDDRRSASHFFMSGCALLRVRHGNGGQDKKFRYKHQKN